MHSRCMEALDEFKEKIKHGSKIIKSFSCDKTVKENRVYMRGVIESIIYTCCQNIGLRGHREHPSEINRGNVLEILTLLENFCPIIEKVNVTSGKRKICAP